jgi:hypothetical protein
MSDLVKPRPIDGTTGLDRKWCFCRMQGNGLYGTGYRST